MTSRKIADIQVLRACAIFFVITAHSSYRELLPERLRHGHTGVDLFFVISGFVITASSLRIIATSGYRNFSRDFLIRRFFRIVPVAVGWLMIYWIGLRLMYGWDITKDVISVLTLRYNYHLTADAAIGHYWSLVLEEHFYIGFAVLFPFLLRVGLLAPLSVIGIVIVGDFLRPFASDPSHFTQARIDSFLAGVLIAYGIENARVFGRTPVARGVMAIAAVPLLYEVWSLFASPVYQGFQLVLMASSALVFIGSADRNVILPIPGLRPALEWVGERSYSIYLSHPFLIFAEALLVQKVRVWAAVPSPIRALVLFASILAVGALSYRFETRSERLGRRFGKAGTRESAVAVPLQPTA